MQIHLIRCFSTISFLLHVIFFLQVQEKMAGWEENMIIKSKMNQMMNMTKKMKMKMKMKVRVKMKMKIMMMKMKKKNQKKISH